MKINNPLNVLRYVNSGLSMASLGVQAIAREAEDGISSNPKKLQHLSEFVSDLYCLTTIALKLSDPEAPDPKLTEQEQRFLTEFYLPSEEEFLQEDSNE